MTSWPDSGIAARRGWGTQVLLIGLILVGWAFALAQALTMDTPGSLAQAGPGMQIFALVKALSNRFPLSAATQAPPMTWSRGRFGSLPVSH